MDDRLRKIQKKIDKGESISDEDTEFLHENAEEAPQVEPEAEDAE